MSIMENPIASRGFLLNEDSTKEDKISVQQKSEAGIVSQDRTHLQTSEQTVAQIPLDIEKIEQMKDKILKNEIEITSTSHSLKSAEHIADKILKMEQDLFGK